MKESHVEGPTGHEGPETCICGCEALEEVLAGVLAGRSLSRVSWSMWRNLLEDRDAEAVKFANRHMVAT